MNDHKKTPAEVARERTAQAIARRIQKRAYVPVSGFRVGAAIIDERGSIHAGCNVENQLQAAIHAEVAALCAMIAGGGIRIDYLAVTSIPCGMCRAILSEFMSEDSVIAVLGAGDGDPVVEYSLQDLYPHAFSLSSE